ncbi:MAG: hypothetical protein L6N95_02840 [Candidatus Methylarchaceae archaeon HK01B]|nr:hypothetical protein [Candidatus Methylarchaceae archaeon HK01B]
MLDDITLKEIEDLCKEKFKDYDGRVRIIKGSVFVYLDPYHGIDAKKIHDEKWILKFGERHGQLMAITYKRVTIRKKSKPYNLLGDRVIKDMSDVERMIDDLIAEYTYARENIR